MINVLHIGVSSTTGVFGGVEKFLMDYYSHIDHQKVHFDFLFCRENPLENYSNREVLSGSSINALHVLKDGDNSLSNYIKLYKAVCRELKVKKYDVVHVDTSLIPAQIACLIAAKRSGNRIRIAHSHSAGNLTTGNFLKRQLKAIVYKSCKSLIRGLATNYFACSEAAGLFLFGRKGIRSPKYKVIHNAIDVEKYRYNVEIRKKVREKIGTEERITVFGSVGRLDPVKNITYLVDVFYQYHMLDPDSELWIVGDGSERENIEKYIRDKGCDSSIKLLGERHDIPVLMQGFDIFLFTSLKEGLGIVAVEAQAAGLPVVAANTIPKETKITSNIKYLKLKEDKSGWVHAIEDILNSYTRVDIIQQLKDAEYDINHSAKELEDYYCMIVKER